MKKLLSFLLVILMMFGSLSGTTLSANAIIDENNPLDSSEKIYVNADGYIYEVTPNTTYTYSYYLQCTHGKINDIEATTTWDFPAISSENDARYPILGNVTFDSYDTSKKLLEEHNYIKGDSNTGYSIIAEQVYFNYLNFDGISFENSNCVLIKQNIHIGDNVSPSVYYINTHIQSLGSEEGWIISNGLDCIPEPLLRRQGELEGLEPVAIESTEYKAEDATYIPKSYEDVTFTVKGSQNDNRTYDKFRALYLDGQLLDQYNNYYIEKGSLKLTFNYAFPESLSKGDHELRFVFCDGEAYATLHINEEIYIPPTEPNPNSIPYGQYNMLNFYVDSIHWKGPVYFYVYEIDSGKAPIAYGSNKLIGVDNGYGKFSYNPKALNLETGKQYGIVFVDMFSGDHTYPLVFDTSCIGDMAYSTGIRLGSSYNPDDALLVTRWKSSNYGPLLQINSVGDIIGETCPANKTPYLMMIDYLNNYLIKARTFSGKEDQQIIDDAAKALGLTDDDVSKAIKESGVTVSWVPTQVAPTEPSTDSYGYVDGAYYLTGSINGDNSGTGNVHKNLRFEQGDTDYTLSYVKLSKGDTVNVAVYRGNNVFIIYPDGTGQEKSIDKSGYYTFYFKPYEIGNPNYWYFSPPSLVGEIVNGILGDADGNGEIESVDATFIQRWLAKIDTPYTKAELMRGDVDGSGDLELMDVTWLQYYLANMRTPYQIGKQI